MKEYKLNIPDECEVENVCKVDFFGKETIVVSLASVFTPKPGDYVSTDDGQVGMKTKNGYFRFKGGANVPFTRFANDAQKSEFDALLNKYGLHFDGYLEKVVKKPKVGDLCIFFTHHYRENAIIRILKKVKEGRWYIDNTGSTWNNCVKFDSKEQYKEILNL